MRISHLCLLGLLGLAVVTALHASKKAPYAAAPLPQKDGLRISIQKIDLQPNFPHINVALINTSAKPINVLREDNSFGFQELRLEIKSVDGKVLSSPLVVQRPMISWSANPLEAETIAPGTTLYRKVNLAEPIRKTEAVNRENLLRRNLSTFPYDGFPLPMRNGTRRIVMHAVYENHIGASFNKGAVWMGTIATPYKQYVLSWKHK